MGLPGSRARAASTAARPTAITTAGCAFAGDARFAESTLATLYCLGGNESAIAAAVAAALAVPASNTMVTSRRGGAGGGFGWGRGAGVAGGGVTGSGAVETTGVGSSGRGCIGLDAQPAIANATIAA